MGQTVVVVKYHRNYRIVRLPEGADEEEGKADEDSALVV